MPAPATQGKTFQASSRNIVEVLGGSVFPKSGLVKGGGNENPATSGWLVMSFKRRAGSRQNSMCASRSIKRRTCHLRIRLIATRIGGAGDRMERQRGSVLRPGFEQLPAATLDQRRLCGDNRHALRRPSVAFQRVWVAANPSGIADPHEQAPPKISKVVAPGDVRSWSLESQRNFMSKIVSLTQTPQPMT